MRAVGDALRAARVAAIYLVHGTFIGPDGLGLLAELSRVSPAMADAVRGVSKRVLDAIAGDAGNFTREYAAQFEELLNPHGTDRIPVRLFHWSSENNHLGRADGAVRLLDHLIQRQFPAGSRVLVWGHSHGGNVLALVTNLLGSELASRRAFFDRARLFFRCPLLRRIDLPEWARVQVALGADRPALADITLDVTTFGTPVRYGWDANGYGQLLHFVNHRPVAGKPEYQAPFPPTTADALHLAPPLGNWRAWWADRRLGRLLQAGCRSRELLTRWRLGVRVHDEGTNLLVDYGIRGESVVNHIFGHAVYTRREWLPYHAEETARRLYGLGPG
jgi:hypothetical protein